MSETATQGPMFYSVAWFSRELFVGADHAAMVAAANETLAPVDLRIHRYEVSRQIEDGFEVFIFGWDAQVPHGATEIDKRRLGLARDALFMALASRTDTTETPPK